jgi:hypothetical protein
MPVVVVCRCTRRFAAPDALLGQQLPCPACGASITVGGASAASGELYVECKCGRAFWAPSEMRGKQARCRACGASLTVGPSKRSGQPVDLASSATPTESGRLPALTPVTPDGEEIPWRTLKLIGICGGAVLAFLIAVTTANSLWQHAHRANQRQSEKDTNRHPNSKTDIRPGNPKPPAPPIEEPPLEQPPPA